jgi:4-hydroxy-tetrahydrodipicolinate reductase
MNIALIGYGRMGKIIEELALSRGHRIAAAVDPLNVSAKTVSGAPCYKSIPELIRDFSGGDIGAALEFTRPDTAAANIKALAEQRIPTVSGTTGWHSGLEEVKQAVEAAGGALVWSSNFSLGANLFYRIAFYAAALMDAFPEYDAGGFEAHHNRKADSPSGTARTLSEGVLSRMKRKKKAVWETLNRPPAPDEFHYPSLRLGSLPGIHSLIFDSPADTIEIRHTARNREGLASGAILAAQWLSGTARQGVFTMDDVLNEAVSV